MPSARAQGPGSCWMKVTRHKQTERKRRAIQLDTGSLHTTLCFVVSEQHLFFIVQISTAAFDGVHSHFSEPILNLVLIKEVAKNL